MKIRQDARWPHAHEGLRRLYEKRVPEGMSQADFGAEYGLGTQGMVWQYLNGYTPLNYDAAAKFARGLRCTIRDFSPEMADALEAEIVPVIGRRARRVAMLAILALPFLINPAPADATELGLNIRMIFARSACALSTHWMMFVALWRWVLLGFKPRLMGFRTCCGAFAKRREITAYA